MSTDRSRSQLEAAVSRVPLLDHRHASIIRQLLNEPKALFSLAVIGLLVFVVVFAPVIAPYEPDEPDYDATFAGPSLEHPFGTDSFGRDIFSRILFGARISLTVGFGVVVAATVLGIPIGLVAGYYSTTLLETVLMRLMDALLAFPGIILALTIMSVLGSSITNIVIALGIVNIPVFARLAHGSVLSLKEEEYIVSAKAVGSSDRKIISRYLFPNALAPLIVQATLVLAFAILNEAALSFLGVGVQPPTPSFGLIMLAAKNFIDKSIWLAIFPGSAVVVTVLAFNFFGDALRDVIDPRQDTDRLK